MGDSVMRHLEDGVFNPECTIMFTFPNLSNSKHSGHFLSLRVQSSPPIMFKSLLNTKIKDSGFPPVSKKGLLFFLLWLKTCSSQSNHSPDPSGLAKWSALYTSSSYRSRKPELLVFLRHWTWRPRFRKRRKKKRNEEKGVEFDLEGSTRYSIPLLTPCVSFRKQD